MTRASAGRANEWMSAVPCRHAAVSAGGPGSGGLEQPRQAATAAQPRGDAERRTPTNAERRTTNGRITLKPRDVWKLAGYSPNVVESVEQHRGRIPLAADERVAQGGGHGAAIRRSPAVTTPVSTFASMVSAGVRSISVCSASIDGVVGREARHAEHRRVAEEDLGERLADDRRDAEPRQPLRRVLARRSAAEVAVDDEDRRAGVARIVERVRRDRRRDRPRTGAARALRRSPRAGSAPA